MADRRDTLALAEGEQGAPAPASFEGECVDEVVFVRVLGEAIAALEGHDVPYVLIGGIASAILGRPRWTRDIDLLVTAEDASRALAALAGAGFATQETNPHWIYKALKQGVVIDLIFWLKGDLYLTEEMLARAPSGEFKGQRLRLIPPEDLLVSKAITHDEQSSRHWHDALGLIARADLDWDYLLRRARYGARRVLSLLLYAQSNDLVVPPRVVRALFDLIEDRGATPESDVAVMEQ